MDTAQKKKRKNDKPQKNRLGFDVQETVLGVNVTDIFLILPQIRFPYLNKLQKAINIILKGIAS